MSTPYPCRWCELLAAIETANEKISMMGTEAPSEALGLKMYAAWEANVRIFHRILATAKCECGGFAARRAAFAFRMNRAIATGAVHSPEYRWRRKMAGLKFRGP